MFEIYPKSIETLKIAEQIGQENFPMLGKLYSKTVDDKLYVIYGHITVDGCLVIQNEKVIDGYYIGNSNYTYQDKPFPEHLTGI